MNVPFDLSLTAGLLQFAVGVCALWLAWRLGAVLAGWLLFCGFAVLAGFNGLEAANLLPAIPEREQAGSVVRMVTAVLMLAAAGHGVIVFKRHRRSEVAARVARTAEEREREDLEAKAREAMEKVNKANEELRQTTARLAAEIADRERRQESEDKTRKEMLEVSRQAGMSEVATAVLHNVGNVLNSVNISASIVADHVTDFKVENIARMANMMRQQGAELGNFLTNDPKGKQLPDYLAKLATHLSSEQSLILREIGFVRSKIEHIKEIVATQQNYGKVMGLTENIHMDELVDDVLRIHAVELSEHEVQVERYYESDLPEVVVDKHKVLQILLNLLSNAKHACMESNLAEKQVHVRVTNGDDKVRVMVSDNGVGIPAANLKAIFNHGFTTRKKGGHGFGLHGSALAAKEIGGALAVQSEGLGRGATFTLEIPLNRINN